MNQIVAATIIVLLIGGFGILHPGFQVVYPADIGLVYDAPVMFMDNGEYHMVRDGGSYWKPAIPFLAPPIEQVTFYADYKYDLPVVSSDGINMIAKINYGFTDEYYDNTLIKKNLQLYGLHWQDIIAHRNADQKMINYAKTQTAERLYRDGYQELKPYYSEHSSITLYASFIYLEKAREAELRAKIDTARNDPYLKAYGKDYDSKTEYQKNYDMYADIYDVPRKYTPDENVASTDAAVAKWQQLKAKHPDLKESDVSINEDGFYHYTSSGNDNGYRLGDDTDYSTDPRYKDNGAVSSQEEANAIIEKFIRST